MDSTEQAQQPSPGNVAESPGAPYRSLRTSCDLCKRMKIKCKREGESCAHCLARRAKCDTTFVKRKRQTRDKRKNHIADIEARIQQVESVLVASGIKPDAESSVEKPSVGTDSRDRLSSLLVDSNGTSHFIGASSGFSLFSPQGLQWISERTGDNDLTDFTSNLAKSAKGVSAPTPTNLWHSKTASDREPLPPKDIASQYVQSYFESFNTWLPLYDREIFNRYYEAQYTDGSPPEGAGWYATLNVVISLGGLIAQVPQLRRGKASNTKLNGLSQKQLWGLFHNACSCFADLLFQDSSLMAVQALCGMAFLQQLTFDPEPCYFLVSSAGRLAYKIGLHRRIDDAGFSPSELDQRRTVLWAVYCIDKSLALRIGHPPIIVDEEIGIDLPPETNQLELGMDGKPKFNTFRYVVQLAIVESRILSELYSIRSRNGRGIERLRSVAQLDKAVQEWREELPIEIRPGEEIKCSEEQLMHVVMIHFAYLNCLATIHRVAIHYNSFKDCISQDDSSLNDQQIKARVHASQAICLTAARNSIELLQYLDNYDHPLPGNFVWIILYYPLSGLLTLFANILQNPQSANVYSDLALMSYTVAFLAPIITQDSPFTVLLSVQLLSKLCKVATKLVQKNNVQQPNSFHLNTSIGIGNQFHIKASRTEAFSTPTDESTDIPDMQDLRMPYRNLEYQDSTIETQELDLLDPNFRYQQSTINFVEPENALFPPEDQQFLGVMSSDPILADYFDWDVTHLWGN
ncbi:hypothetical protein BP6252_08940 [Coleophoma cylindrospora]|uniref:Zn(2)-C6 fungal-type domain-containing protein n=1 Tax=Coleophoma cylindrospora TaxID=1849047 RepID=A0A3D8R134_9HELO|nr:hypothetical protein BP6252_08940 [Coleophoma cylindrospora]